MFINAIQSNHIPHGTERYCIFKEEKKRVNDNMDLTYVNNILKNGEKTQKETSNYSWSNGHNL